MTKLEAIEYLAKHNVYGNEWQGAGMWEAVEKVLESTEEITPLWLNTLLKAAENR